MSTFTRTATLFAFLLTVLLFSSAFAHETQTVGEGENEIRVIVGMVREPIFTGERNGLDLIVQDAQGEPIENLENSLEAEFRSPDGSSTHTMTLRAQWGKPGYYTDDIVLTEAGDYEIHITGFIGEQEIDLTFATHGVAGLSDISFP